MTPSRSSDVEEAARAAAEAHRCVALRARRLSRLVTRLFEEALRDEPVTLPQFTLVGATILKGPLSPAQLARELDLDKSTLSRNLRLLERAGLLRCEEAAGGVGQRIHPTDRGRRVFVRALPAWRAAQARAVEAMGAGVIERLDDILGGLGGERPARRTRRP